MPRISLGPDHFSRYREHYDNTLSTDMLYMTYDHKIARKPARLPEPKPVLDPYMSNRPGKQVVPRPRAKAITHARVPELESITIHSMNHNAVFNKQHLLNTIMQLRAVTGESPKGGGRPGSTGIQVIKAKIGAAQWKLREGMPIACKVELKGDAMYDFLQSLVDFVLPRLREYPGAPIVPVQGSSLKPNLISGTVSFGLKPAAMGLFPQIEANIDSYARLVGFHIYFHTNLKGENAELHVKNLLSGFRIPFQRQ